MPHIGKQRNLYKDSSKKVEEFIKDPRFIARMAKLNSTPIDRRYDIPYLGGYSKDGSKVYFDRHFVSKFDGVDISKFIKVHEVSEKALLDLFPDMNYQKAHHIATHLERQKVEAAGLNWDKYCKYLEPYIKEVSKEKLQTVPKDLDLEPYKDEKDTKLLQSLMKKEKSLKESVMRVI
jgi:hypothetical protein